VLVNRRECKLWGESRTVTGQAVSVFYSFMGSHTESDSRRAIIRGRWSNIWLPQGSVLGPLLFIAYVNDIWRNTELTIRLFADDCVLYRKVINNEDIDSLQEDLDRLGEWAAENAMKINPSKCKAVRFTRARVKNPLNYTIRDQLIPEASSCK